MSQAADEMSQLAELQADNRRLRRLLDQQGAPGELRHRLRNTVAMLRAIIRRSADTHREVEGYVAHVEDRLEALMRAQSAADEHGMIELHSLLADELLHYGASEGGRADLSGPIVELQPRAGQVLAIAIHELAVNAVEHGALGTSIGRIEVTWSVDASKPQAWLTVDWKERDKPAFFESSHEGFGTEVLTRTLQYEIKAETTRSFEPDGLRCTIRIPLSERVGRVSEGGTKVDQDALD